MKKKPVLIVITGPTASGKSALAVSLAKQLDTEIINADSRQIYKGIPIVTAVPTEEEKSGIRHHLLEILNLEDYYSAAKFENDANLIIAEIFKSRDFAIVCGGSMLYLDTLLKGIDDLPDVPPEFRQELMTEWKRNGDAWLLAKLKEVDPGYYDKIDHRNLKRVFHAVEISLISGKSYTSLLSGRGYKKELPFNTVKICLSGPREELFDKINGRVLKMVKQGLEEEARKIYHLRHLNSLNTVGLKEMFAYFEGALSFDEAVVRIQKNTRVYAKKQITWHKRDNTLNFIDFLEPISSQVNKILDLI